MNQSVEAEALFSAQWWQNRSNQELHELMRGGFASEESCAGAYCELERRAREQVKAQERAAEREAERKKRLRLKILGGMLLAVLLALLAALIVQ